jgi:Leucine-rich repeat (LRR) protein
MKSLDTGEWITKLTNLKRLTIGAYGLTSLHPDFKNLKSLEFLDLGSNCFQNIPEILTPENFPNLHSLVLTANQRNTIYDLSNDIRENIGGFIEDTGLKRFKDILKWNQLDTIRLSVNYFQGEIPDMKHEGLPVWTYEELKDSLATGMTQLPEKLQNLPKVLPDTKFFAINFNRFTGSLPDWILYHPNLDMWAPYSLVFSQEGKTREGKNAGFENEPASLDYYYDIYYNKKYNPNKK